MDSMTPPSPEWPDCYYGHDVHPLYTGPVHVTGEGAAHDRASGVVRSDDGLLEMELRLPEALGGKGGGSNPEQLVAAVYTSCFHGAMNLLAMRAGTSLTDAKIDVALTSSRDPADGLFALTARLDVYLHGVDRARAAELVRHIESMCPYARLSRQGTEHVVAVVKAILGIAPEVPPW